MLTVTLYSHANPDLDQTQPPSPTVTVTGATIDHVVTACADYIGQYDLGGGNWPEPIIYRDGQPVARISYNGRLWHPTTEKAMSPNDL